MVALHEVVQNGIEILCAVFVEHRQHLIENEHLGLCCDGRAYGDAHHLAFGEHTRIAVPESLYMQSVKHLIDTGAYFVRRHTPILQGECDFVLHLVGDEQIHRVLGHIPHLGGDIRDARAFHVHASHPDETGKRAIENMRDDTGEGLRQCGLARTGRPYYPGQGSLRHITTHIMQCPSWRAVRRGGRILPTQVHHGDYIGHNRLHQSHNKCAWLGELLPYVHT